MTKTRERSRRMKKEKGRILKRLISRNTGKSGGRNSAGRITSFHRGGGTKRLLRTVDTKRDVPAAGIVERIEYDPNRSSRIALVRWTDGVSLPRDRRPRAGGAQNRLNARKIEETVEAPSSMFSFSSVPGRVDPKVGSLPSSSSSQVGCLPKNYVMIGGQDRVRGFLSSSLSSSLKGETVTETAASAMPLNLPRIAVAGAKPTFFAARAEGDERIGENMGLAEIQRWVSKSTERRAALSWQCPGLFESKPRAGQHDLIPTQVLSYALSGGRPSHQNRLLLKANVGRRSRDEAAKAKVVDCAPLSYIVASDKLEAGNTVVNAEWTDPMETNNLKLTGQNAELQRQSYEKLDLNFQVGNCIPLADIRMGTWVHSVEMRPGEGARLVRAGGTHAKVIKHQDSQCLIRLPSGVEKLLDSRCRATIGVASNPEHGARKLKKAGQNRWLGWRPVVRGVAMNPVDHPHGGGEGRTKGGRPSVSPWGKPTKGGYKTVIKAVSKGRL